MRNLRKVGLLAMVAATVTVASVPASAGASKWCVSKSGDGSTVCARDGADAGTGGHEYVDICDSDADGHYVYARAGGIWAGAAMYWISVTTAATGTEGYDRNGATAGCSTYDYGRMVSYAPFLWQGLEPQAIAVCVQSEGCSPMKFHDGSLDSGPWQGYTPSELPRVAG